MRSPLFVCAVLATALSACASAQRLNPATPTLAAVVVADAERMPAPEDDPAPPPAPATVAKATPRHEVDIIVDALPPPRTIDAVATTFVFWVRSNDRDAWANAAHLAPDATTREAVFAHEHDDLYVLVTAEEDGNARAPSMATVVTTRVTRNGACASMIDRNAVQMRVRMCKEARAEAAP